MGKKKNENRVGCPPGAYAVCVRKPSGTAKLSVCLARIDSVHPAERVRAYMKEKGHRPAGLKELLALERSCKDLQNRYPIVALAPIIRMDRRTTPRMVFGPGITTQQPRGMYTADFYPSIGSSHAMRTLDIHETGRINGGFGCFVKEIAAGSD
jgi:hypothetical protein